MAEQEIITADGEVITTGLPAMIDDAMAGTLARAEIDMQIATAHKFPRSIKRAIDNIVSLATLDEETAEECIYALKRGGKPLRGPSIRLAEIIVQQWGNNRCGAVVTSIDRVNKIIVAEGFFHDLETNSATRASVQRRISNSEGRIYSDDMITVTGNAACSIAKRNAILAGVPKGVWRRAVDAAEDVIRGDVKTLAERRARALAALAHYNLSAADVFAIMEVGGEDDLGVDDLVTLSAIRSNLKNGETTAEELLRGTKAAKPAHQVVENALADKAPEKTSEIEAGAPGSGGGPAGKSMEKPADAETASAKGDGAVDWNNAAEVASALKAGKLPDGYFIDASVHGDTLVVPDDAINEKRGPRGHSSLFASFDEIRTKSGKVLKSKSAEAAEPKESAKPKVVENFKETVIDAVKTASAAIDAAYERGTKAKAAGMARKAVPPEYREKDRADEATAWLEGYDSAKSRAEEAKAGEQEGGA